MEPIVFWDGTETMCFGSAKDTYTAKGSSYFYAIDYFGEGQADISFPSLERW